MKYTIIGAGKSGYAAALLADRKGHQVFLTESKTIDNYAKEVEIFDKLGIKYEFGGNTEKCFADVDCIITSPGVLPSTWVIKTADERNIPVISELEFARSFIPEQKIIAITGTNGKTTTTTLIHYILQQSGLKTVAAGNIGTPLSELVDNIDIDTIVVAELSSFQLDRIRDFRADISLILNISPDHLYYHGTFDEYRKAKFKIAKNITNKDFLVLNADDEESTAQFAHTSGEILYFSLNPVEYGVYAKEGKMYVRLPNMPKEEEIMVLDEIKLPGVHNAYNAMAAALAARVFEIRNENIRDCLMAFEGVEHRLEYVRSIDGVDYVNDSKATNVNATWYALSSYKKPLVWLAGGRGDNNDYSALDSLVRKNVQAIVCIGEESDAIFNHFAVITRCIKADSMEDAVIKAQEIANSGEIVLFTPACKSFDMFMNFEHRGDVFKDIVRSL